MIVEGIGPIPDVPLNELIKKVQEEHSVAETAELYTRAYHFIYRTVRMQGGYPDDAEDIAQDILTRLLVDNVIQNYKTDGYSFFAYLKAIVLRELWRQNRGKNSDLLNSAIDIDTPEVLNIRSTNDDIESYVIVNDARKELFEIITNALKNSRQSFIVIARFFSELQPNEIAQILGITVTKVYMEHHRAIQRLKNDPHMLELFKELLND